MRASMGAKSNGLIVYCPLPRSKRRDFAAPFAFALAEGSSNVAGVLS